MNANWLSHPFDELSHLRHTIDDAIKNWTTPFASNPSLDWGWKPRMDICENRNFFKILLELPGFQKEDLDVQVNGRFLSIKGSKSEHKDTEWKYHRRERYSGGEFHRAVALPEGIDGNSIQAKFQGGILTLTVPKTGGKIAQHINLMGKEEHFNKHFVLDAEEDERKRRMEEMDPKLSRKAWTAGRIGTVIDEERERQRRIDEIEHYYQRNSIESCRASKLAESKEKDRRMKDQRGEAEKKKNARKIAGLIKQLGNNPKSRLRKTNFSAFASHGAHTKNFRMGSSRIYPNTFAYSGFKSVSAVSKLEDRERQRRIQDKALQQQHKLLAKKVSGMIKNCRGIKNLQPVNKKSLTIKSNYQYNDPYSFQFRVKSNTKALEEKERQRRVSNKQVQQQQKQLAKRISNMIKQSSGVLNLHHTYQNKNSFLTLEKDRQRKLIDMIGKATF